MHLSGQSEPFKLVSGDASVFDSCTCFRACASDDHCTGFKFCGASSKAKDCLPAPITQVDADPGSAAYSELEAGICHAPPSPSPPAPSPPPPPKIYCEFHTITLPSSCSYSSFFTLLTFLSFIFPQPTSAS